MADFTGNEATLDILSSSLAGLDGLLGQDVSFGHLGAPPQVTFLNPAAGNPIQPGTTISLNIVDFAGFSDLIITVRWQIWQSILNEELVHNGTNFVPGYLGTANARTAIVGGWNYTILKDGGWPGPMTLCVYATDPGGNTLQVIS